MSDPVTILFKGLDGFSSLVLGNTLIMLGFVFLGPIPQLSVLSGFVFVPLAILLRGNI